MLVNGVRRGSCFIEIKVGGLRVLRFSVLFVCGDNSLRML